MDVSKNRTVAVATLLLPLLLLISTVSAKDGDEEQSAEDEARSIEQREYIEVNVSYLPTSNTIATKLPVPLHLTPANVGSVSAPLLREQAAVVLGDALYNISGLNPQTGSGVHDYFIIRGFNSLDGGLVLTDGASEPEVSFYSLYNVQGVEVLKGPGGFLYGSNPLAGAVNIVRKQPLPGNFTVIGGTLGSHDTWDGNLDWNLASGDANRSFRLNTTWRESDNYRDDKASRHTAINPSFAWKLGESSTLTFNLEYVDAEYSPDAGIPLLGGEIPDVPRSRSYQLPGDFSDQEIRRFQIDFETELGEGLKLRNKLYHRDLDWQSNGTLFVGTSGTEALRTLTLLDDRQRFTGNQLEVILTRNTGPVTHNLLFGLEVARFTDEFGIDFVPPENTVGVPGFPGVFVPGVPNIDLFNPVETFTGVEPQPFLAGDTRSRIIAPYVIDQIELSDRFRLLVGARYDDIDFEDDVTAASRDDSEVSPMAGVVYSPDPSLSLYASFGESFAPASPRIQGSPEPEASRQFELGAKKLFYDGKMRTTFAVYELERDNIAIPDDNGFTQQAGDQRSRGFEFELAAEPLPRLRTFLSYAYTDAELTEFTERVSEMTVDHSGNTPAFVPKHLLNFWVSRSFRNGFGVAGGGRYFGDQFIAEDNAFEIDAATILDAAVFYDRKTWRFTLNVKNLTDEDYETRGFGSNSVIPGNPFRVFAGFEYRM